MKVCPKCGAPNPTSSSYCVPCRNKYQREWYKKFPAKAKAWMDHRRAAIRKLVRDSKNVPCADCHLPFPWYCMDFDHVRGKKLFTLGTAPNKLRAIEVVKREIAKCDPVCSNCHRKRTYRRGCKEFKD